jgi:hypothetical protein
MQFLNVLWRGKQEKLNDNAVKAADCYQNEPNLPLVKIFCLLPLPVLSGFTACRIRLQVYCINTLTVLVLILQN